ncbi:MAG: TIGR03118 family protein [Phycisphaerales bacterium]
MANRLHASLVSVAMLPVVAAALLPSTASAQVYPTPEQKMNAPQWVPLKVADREDYRNAYVVVNLVSTRESDKALMLDPMMKNAWGLALRPPGKGGHWWVSNAGTGTTTTYVGDAPGHRFEKDKDVVVSIPIGKLHATHAEIEKLKSQPTGQVYTGFTSKEFVVEGEGKKGSAKFLFVTLDGTVTGWTTDQTKAVIMVDNSTDGSMYTGCAVTTKPEGNRLFLADWGLEKVTVLDGEFKPVKTEGDFTDPKVSKDYRIYNMQVIGDKVYAAWARIGDAPGEAEAYPGYGFISCFDFEGKLVKSFEHRQELITPWGIAMAPKDFGALSGKLLVGNFGDGRILSFDPETGKFVDYLRAPDGKPVELDGLWDLKWGNGETLGYLNHLYFTAGPEQEEQGLFGKLVPLFP